MRLEKFIDSFKDPENSEQIFSNLVVRNGERHLDVYVVSFVARDDYTVWFADGKFEFSKFSDELKDFRCNINFRASIEKVFK